MAKTLEINLEELAGFLVRAKKATYAGDGAEIPAESVQRPGFKELEYTEGDWEYKDSYTGFFRAPGQEVVRLKGEPIWVMSYNGGMAERSYCDIKFAKRTFEFLKEALLQVPKEAPFRGPAKFSEDLEENFLYFNDWNGDITDFSGEERILFGYAPVFLQNYFGGLIVPKNYDKRIVTAEKSQVLESNVTD